MFEMLLASTNPIIVPFVTSSTSLFSSTLSKLPPFHFASNLSDCGFDSFDKTWSESFSLPRLLRASTSRFCTRFYSASMPEKLFADEPHSPDNHFPSNFSAAFSTTGNIIFSISLSLNCWTFFAPGTQISTIIGRLTSEHVEFIKIDDFSSLQRWNDSWNASQFHQFRVHWLQKIQITVFRSEIEKSEMADQRPLNKNLQMVFSSVSTTKASSTEKKKE